MPYQNDLMSLADVVSPAYAAGHAMTQEDLANQQEQIKTQVARGQAPAEIARPGLQNLFTQAQTGAEQGIAQQQQAKGQEAQALLPGQIKTGQATSETQYGAQKLQQFQQMGMIANQAAGMMDNVPEAARPAAMAQLAQKYGIDPKALGPLADGNPDNLRNFSQKLIQGSQDYQTKYMQEQSATERTGIQSQGRVQAADIAAEARRQVAETQAAMRQAIAPLGALQQQIYAKVANGTATPAERQALDSMNQVQQLTRQGSPFQAGITGTNVQPNVPAVPNTTPQQQQPSAGPTTGPATEQLAKQHWGSYEPDKYDYGINPNTGNYARRLKGQ